MTQVVVEPRLTYSASEAARLIGVSKNTLYLWLQDHPGLSVRVGRRILISRRRLQEWIDGGGEVSCP